MALIQAFNPSTGGSGEAFAAQIDTFSLTEPFVSGETLTLSQSAIPNTVILYSEGPPLGFASWQQPAANQVELLFGADPATDTDDGTWTIYAQYLYTT